MTFENINRKYREIWKEYLGEKKLTEDEDEATKMHLNRWPIQYPPEKMFKNSILFVGFNPSYNEKAFEELNINDGLLSNPTGTLDNRKKIEDAIEYENEAIGIEAEDDSSPYYRRFPEIVCDVYDIKDANGKWSHLDILPIREKNQSDLIRDLDLNRGNLFNLSGEYKSFVKENLSVFAEAVSLLDPRVIVVVNGYVSRSIIANYGSPFPSLNESNNDKENAQRSNNIDNIFRVKADKFKETGARTFSVNSNKGYPLLLTSMLTGQRALGLGSRERLIWHLRLLLEK